MSMTDLEKQTYMAAFGEEIRDCMRGTAEQTFEAVMDVFDAHNIVVKGDINATNERVTTVENTLANFLDSDGSFDPSELIAAISSIVSVIDGDSDTEGFQAFTKLVSDVQLLLSKVDGLETRVSEHKQLTDKNTSDIEALKLLPHESGCDAACLDVIRGAFAAACKAKTEGLETYFTARIAEKAAANAVSEAPATEEAPETGGETPAAEEAPATDSNTGSADSI